MVVWGVLEGEVAACDRAKHFTRAAGWSVFTPLFVSTSVVAIRVGREVCELSDRPRADGSYGTRLSMED